MTSQPPPPPGSYPPPTSGGYPSPQGPQSGQPDSNLVWAILSTMLCCLPLGVVAIVKSTQVSGLWAQGRYAEAQKSADDAKKFAIWGAAAGVVVAVIWLVVAVVGGMAGMSSG